MNLVERTSRRWRARRFVAIAFSAMTVLMSTAAPASARAPLSGADNMPNYERNQVLTFKFAGAYPNWLDGAGAGVRLVLESQWDNRSYNRSGLPTFTYSATGTGIVTYSSAAESPCSDVGNTSWLACSSNWGQTTFRIYVRNFAASGKASWAWNESGDCSGKTCFDLSRALLHELIHITLGVGSHDNSGESKTVMSATQPSSPATGWNRSHIMSCDEATGQLYYDLDAKTSRYADCLVEVAGVPASGLDTSVVTSNSSYTGCQHLPLVVNGRAQVVDNPEYLALGGNPLIGRRIYVDRRPAGTTTWQQLSSTLVDATGGNNFSVTLISESVPFEYRFRFNDDDGNDSTDNLQPASDTISVSWLTCPY